MKTSWIIGCVLAYMLIFACEMFVTGGSAFGGTTSSNVTNVVTTNQTTLISPTFQESTNLFTAAWAVVTHVASYMGILVKILMLWAPTVFSGDMIWVYWFVCFPVAVGFNASLVFIVRGVHSA